MKQLKFWLIGMVASLSFGMAACSDDDKSKDENTTPPAVDDISGACSGDECQAKQQEADSKAEACDFDAAYSAINAVYLGQVASNKVEPQTAFDRSVLGIIHLLYRDEVQKLLPRLGFIASNSVVDFKPVWNMPDGFFEQVFKATHEYGDVYEKLPLRYAQEDVNYLDTIDRKLTFDEVLDVLVALKPDLESLANSFAAAAATKSAISPSSNFGCGLNNFQMDAADLNMMAAIFYAADAFIDLLAKYDFNYGIYDYFKAEDAIYDDDRLELDSCFVNFDGSGNVSSNECQDEYDKDYKTLECFDLSLYGDSDNRQVCFIPDDSDEYKNRQKLLDLLNPHLFKKTSKSRQNSGLDGLKAFQNFASHLLNALNNTAKGKFFDFSSLPAGALADIKDIVSKVSEGTVDLSKYIKPSLSIDLSKVFTNVLYRTDDLRALLNPWPEVDVYDVDDYVDYVIGEETFIAQDVLNYITNTTLVTSKTSLYATEYEDNIYYHTIDIEFYMDDRYDATFSSDWEDFDISGWLNPHEYFGSWESDEESYTTMPYPYPEY